MPTIVFYISGHGFGHATRDIEVINTLLRRRNDVRVVVRTSVAKWLFDLTLGDHASPPAAGGPSRVEYHGVETDTGVVQIDSLHLDAVETVRRAREFMRDFDGRASREAQYLRDIDAAAVVADIPPLGIAAAARVSIPAVALGNFSWDWAYAPYGGSDAVVRAVAEAYTTAEVAIRLPLHGGFDAFRRVVDIPFIAHSSRRAPAETRRALDLPLHDRLVLVSFGGYGLQGLDLEALGRLQGYRALVSASVPLAHLPAGRGAGHNSSVLPIDEQKLFAAGFLYEDLVRAVDVVVTKPGYGIIADCLANDTAILYTSRGHFIEYDVLVREMPRVVRCRYIDHQDLFAGRWTPHLDALLAQPAPPERPGVDGADVAADIVLAAMDGAPLPLVG